jgi:hypothetical protein
MPVAEVEIGQWPAAIATEPRSREWTSRRVSIAVLRSPADEPLMARTHRNRIQSSVRELD